MSPGTALANCQCQGKLGLEMLEYARVIASSQSTQMKQVAAMVLILFVPELVELFIECLGWVSATRLQALGLILFEVQSANFARLPRLAQ